MFSSLTRMFGFAKRMHSSMSASVSASASASASASKNSLISIYCNVCNNGYHEPAIIRVEIDGTDNEYKVCETIDKKYRFENIKNAPVDHYTYN